MIRCKHIDILCALAMALALALTGLLFFGEDLAPARLRRPGIFLPPVR